MQLSLEDSLPQYLQGAEMPCQGASSLIAVLLPGTDR